MILVHSVETLGALDGPGIRTVIFLQGCPCRCSYCHNADAIPMTGGMEYDEAELCAFCVNYKAYYGKNGGVTLSGGEPLVQSAAVIRLIKLLKSEGIRVALDTSGAIFAPEVLSLCDLVLLDIKHTDPIKFEELTGVKMDNTLKTLAYLKENSIPFWIRQVILRGFTDSAEQVLRLKELVSGAIKTELLPYHGMGAHKWEKLGIEYKLKDVKHTDAETMTALKALLK